MKVHCGKTPAGRKHLFRTFSPALFGLLLFFAGCTGFGLGHPEPVTIAQVVEMSRAGDPPREIIQQIRDSGTVYRLNPGEVARLREEGVPEAVIDYMQQTYIDSVRRDQALMDWGFWYPGDDGIWYGGRAFGWPYGDEFYALGEFGGRGGIRRPPAPGGGPGAAGTGTRGKA